MYDIRNKGDAIVRLNEYLLDVAYVDPRIPKVSLEPFFSPRTTEAVLAFQKTEGLSPTGTVRPGRRFGREPRGSEPSESAKAAFSSRASSLSR